MDLLSANRLFRRLFIPGTCSRCRLPSLYGRNALLHDRSATVHARSFFWEAQAEREKAKRYARRGKGQEPVFWRARADLLYEDRREDYAKYPMVTADDLRIRAQRPRRVKMLMRDFVEDSLYNPSYGYFSKQAVIFTPGEPFNFHEMKDEPAFYDLLGQTYTAYEDALDKKEPSETRQLWHTPTELFTPYYGEAMARYMVANYQLSLYPYYDLIIYEMGAGNGTMMVNILDYIRASHPEVYNRTQYKIIEISSALATLQADQLRETAANRGHKDKVQIINRSIFDWDNYVSSPCFFLALEVFDNFAHDAIRYNSVTQEALQSHVMIDGNGDFFEMYSQDVDPVALRYLKTRDIASSKPFATPAQNSGMLRRLLGSTIPSGFTDILPPNRDLSVKSKPQHATLSSPEYIPTRLMQFFSILHNYFPAHRLISSDFSTLPDAVVGLNGPVVQTRYKRRMIPVSTPLVQQGYFDILFPTDFAVASDMYRAITGKFCSVVDHEEFMERWAWLEDTATRSGENPLVTWYGNAKFMVTV